MSFSTAFQNFGEERILQALAGAFPYLTKRIRDVRGMGKDIKQILKTFEGMNPKQLKKLDRKAQYSSNPLIQAAEARRATSAERLKEKAVPALGALGIAGLLAPFASRGLSAAGGAAKDLLSQLPSFAREPKQPQEGVLPPGSPQAITPGPAPMSGAPIQPATIPEAPIGEAPLPSQVALEKAPLPSVLDELGVADRVVSMAQEGLTPDAIANNLLREFTPEQRKKWHAKSIPQKLGLSQVVKDYLTTPEGFLKEQFLPSDQEKREIAREQKIQAPKKVEKGDIVFDEETGQVGTLKDKKKKEGLFEADGKLHKGKLDDLETISPEYQELFDQLTNIPEEERSAPLDTVTYIPETKDLILTYSSGKTYLYRDIDPEIADTISKEVYLAKTSGETATGIWKAGEVSRGAALNELIKKNPKYAKDQEGKTWFRSNTLHDAIQRYREFRKKLFEIKKRSRS